MRPVLVVVGAVVAALGANALAELVVGGGDRDAEYRGRALALAYASGLTLVGVAVLAAGLLWR